MNNILAQIILAARNEDDQGWMQILVFLVMGVVWLVGGLMKARANKVKQSDFSDGEKKSQPPRPLQSQLHTSPEPMPKTFRQASPIPDSTAPKSIEMTAPQLPNVKKISQLRSLELEPTAKVQKSLSELLNSGSSAPSAQRFRGLIDVDDPDALKRAILHYEILGKPVSLRQQPGL